MNEQELQQAFIQYLIQKTGAKSQQELEAIIQQMGEEGLKQAYAEFMQQMQQQQVRSAKFGAKLNYIKQLRGQCPDGYEVKYFKNGGGITEKKCVACQKGQEIPEPTNPVEAFKCGRKTKKKENGGSVEMDKCGGKTKKKACGGDIKKGQKGTELLMQQYEYNHPQVINSVASPGRRYFTWDSSIASDDLTEQNIDILNGQDLDRGAKYIPSYMTRNITPRDTTIQTPQGAIVSSTDQNRAQFEKANKTFESIWGGRGNSKTQPTKKNK